MNPQSGISLFTPYELGDLKLKNRCVMAPLTRNRATKGNDAPNELMAQYYAQRASAGLIISEATQISQQGQGYVWTPGIYNETQIEGWRKVTQAVHDGGGLIFNQLWHVGRISHVSLQPSGAQPVSSSATRANAQTFIESGFAEVSQPHALELHEIASVVEDYRRAAGNAKLSGFDGVEIHAANGYLIDQFLRDSVNKRTDIYGGTVENRARFALEVTDAILQVWDKSNIGMRLSPVTSFNDISDSNPDMLFKYLVSELDKRGIGYIHVIEGETGGPRDAVPFDFAGLRRAFSGAYIANNGYTRELAVQTLQENRADLIAFGRPYIANPDLVERLEKNAPLNQLDQATLYGGDAKGYTDYPFLTKQAAE